MDKTTKGKTTNKTVQKDRQYNGQNDKGKTTIYKTVSQEGQTIQWTKRRKEKQQSTKP